MLRIPAYFSATCFVAMLCFCLLFVPAFIRPCILKAGKSSEEVVDEGKEI